MRNFIQTIIATIFLVSCQYSNKKMPSRNQLTENEVFELSLSNNYNDVNSLVISKQCLNCHSQVGGNKGQLNLETYENIKLNLNKIMFRVLETQDMPTGGLVGYDFDLIKLWLESGAPEKNTLTNPPKPISGPLNWLVIKNSVLDRKCTYCHNSTNQEGRLDLTDFEVVKNNSSIIFERSLVKQDMPPAFFDALNVYEKQALIKWMSQGFNK